ncbi:alpha/beta hydrolase family protein [Gimibacter soli]|uniref:Alpha/beta fold hydrolase n=1 Tax=Gimibacter soli TaxID=3024400 RepID=A0AAF0BM47_9PROT|nr:alpha/beta fold hydrolase [Gimibacter soli]WCL55037.1 alpha/beta fold hydrolase [Gimibacter soli]
MPATKIIFKGSQDHDLAAKLDAPEGTPRAYALFAHCFTCGKDLNAINRIARALNAEGIALFRFDFTGLGLSNGDFANTNFSSNVADLIAAADHMRAELAGPAIMLGHSLGGAATLVAAGSVPEVKAVATIGAPADSENVLKQFGQHLETIEAEGEAEVNLSGRPFRIKKQFIEDVRAQSVHDHIARLKKPLLVMHSPIDATVSVDHARRIFDAAKHPKSFVSLDKADHLLMDRAEDGIYVAKIISAWVSQYIE